MIQKRATSVAFFFLTSIALSHTSYGLAQDAVYRCGNEYTNDASSAKRADCQRVAGTASVTIPASKRAMEVKKSSQPNSLGINKNLEQQARDADAKRVIESELKKSEVQRLDVNKQYEQLSASQDVERKLALKQQLARLDADIVSLKRELKR
jgi:uncharacterized membrane protein YdfJ with MMPL/SSD domain